jgi:hypothetical protein
MERTGMALHSGVFAVKPLAGAGTAPEGRTNVD